MPDQGPAQRLPDFSEPAWQHCRRVLAVWIVAALFLLLSMTVAQAQDTSLSAPLSGSIGEPIYSESEQGGPSTSLIPGDTSLTNPYIRTGISDPLNFLIESGLMTPYAPESSLVTSYADTEVPNLVLNDSTVAARFSEYRGNRLLMSGAGNNSLRTGRASSAGTTVTGQSGTQTAEAGFATSDKAGLLAPFAAGSSALAARQSATSTLLDPNAMIAAATSSAYLGGVQGAASNAPASAPGMAAGVSSSSPDLTGDSTTRTASPVSSMVPPPTNMPSGPAPGDLFPDLTMAVSSGTGFEDSTMDTAGSSYETGDVSISPSSLRTQLPVIAHLRR